MSTGANLKESFPVRFTTGSSDAVNEKLPKSRLLPYGHSDTPAPKQDVVSINIVPDVPEVLMAKQNHSPMSMNLDNSDKFMQTCVLEVKIQDFSIGIHNDADPMLLAQTLRILKELSCDISGLDNIYIVCGYTDMRKSIDGLCAVVETQLRMNPASSSLFLFCGRRRDRIKALFKDRDGYVLIYKRLSVEGGYQWPRKSSEARNLTFYALRSNTLRLRSIIVTYINS